MPQSAHPVLFFSRLPEIFKILSDFFYLHEIFIFWQMQIFCVGIIF